MTAVTVYIWWINKVKSINRVPAFDDSQGVCALNLRSFYSL